MIELSIFQGDSSDTVKYLVYSSGVQVTNLVSNGYSATFSIVQNLGDDPIVTKTMTEVDDSFRSTLLPSDTVNITPGRYWGVVQVVNSGSNYKKEDHFRVKVNKQGYSS